MGGKRLWKVVRIAFLVLGKGLISKAKMMHATFINNRPAAITMKRSFIDNFTTSFHRSSCQSSGSSSLVEYEFSCNNSPDILFYHRPHRKMKKNSSFQLFFFFLPCVKEIPEALEEGLSRHDRVVFPDKTPSDQYMFKSLDCDHYTELWDDEEEGSRVDADAEEFIKRFYEQLKGESPTMLRFG